MEYQPLVSIPVITYNSSKYVLETLESIKSQTYKNIELVVSDDCSSDTTVDVCRNWIEQNNDRFVRTIIVKSSKNTGVSANCNRAEDACNGDWIKIIAGDDILLPNCVEEYVRYVQDNTEAWNVFGKVEVFGGSEQTNQFFSKVIFDYSFFSLTSKEQYQRLVMKGNCIPASTVFYNRNKVKKQNIRYDEQIPLMEDFPRWILLAKKGEKFNLLDKVTVRYRISDDSISTGNSSSGFKKSQAMVFLKYQLKPNLIKEPWSSLYKYLCVKIYLSPQKKFFFFKRLFIFLDRVYCKITHNKRVYWNLEYYYV